MSRIWLAAPMIAGLAVWSGPAAACHPVQVGAYDHGCGDGAKGAATKTVTIANTSFSPTTVSIAPGDTVRWRWNGPDTNHSATADSGESEQFDSDPGNPFPNHAVGDTFDHRYAKAGKFGFHCKVHDFMVGEVRVATPGSDIDAPTVKSLKVKPSKICRKKTDECTKTTKAKLTFKLSEAAAVRARVASTDDLDKTLKKLKLDGESGSNKLTLSSKKLAVGKYRVSVTATDAAGNVSKVAKATFRVREKS